MDLAVVAILKLSMKVKMALIFALRVLECLAQASTLLIIQAIHIHLLIRKMTEHSKCFSASFYQVTQLTTQAIHSLSDSRR